MHISSYYFTRYSSDKRTSPLQNFPDVGLDHLMRSFSQKGISEDVISILLKNVKDKSIQKYQGYWSRFYSWCIEREVNQSNLSVDYLCKFFNFLFESGLSASTLKFARSSISYFLKESHPNITDHPYISRQIQAFEKIRPTVFRYVVTWDVKIVLDLLRSWYPHNTLSMKHLTLKACMLIAISSSDRAQTIQHIRSDNCVRSAKGVEFPIFSTTKTSRHLRRPRVVVCPKWPDPAIDVERCVTDYMARSLTLRLKVVKQRKPKPTQLFISFKTGLPVSRPTISRWLTEVMSMAGIDTSYFKGHSTRVASVSKAKSRGATPEQIINQGDWTNINTFHKHYDRPIMGPAISSLILNN